MWKFDVETSTLAQLTRGEGLNINPFFSPDGSLIAFQSDRDGRLEVWLMNADGSQPRQLTSTGVMGHFLRWSRDAQSIFFRCPNAPGARTMKVSISVIVPCCSLQHWERHSMDCVKMP